MDRPSPRRAAPPLVVVVRVVAVGGALGALARHGLAVAVPASPGALPVATLLTNLSGCLALGLLAGAWPEAPWLRPFLGTGVLGGFTTFSTFAIETDRLPAAAPVVALGYVSLSTAGGVALAAAGLRLGRR